MNVLSHQITGLSDDMKEMREDLQTLLKKEDIETLIDTSVRRIVNELLANQDVTIAIKVKEETKLMNEKLADVKKENECLKKEIVTLKTHLKSNDAKIAEIDARSKLALSMSNYNEQYSRKNNVKVMDIAEIPNETEQDLVNTVSDLFKKKDVIIEPSKIMAIHRIPGKEGHARPVLVKFMNNNAKTKVMVHRTAFKQMGNRLVDDVTRLNAQLIERLSTHARIQQAWFFNGAVYGRSTDNRRHKIDLFDDIKEITK